MSKPVKLFKWGKLGKSPDCERVLEVPSDADVVAWLEAKGHHVTITGTIPDPPQTRYTIVVWVDEEPK